MMNPRPRLNQNQIHYYGRAKTAWARWAARAASTNDPHAKHVMDLCRRWMDEERHLLRLPSEHCRTPEICRGGIVCPHKDACDE
jgi:hypothetical protein